MAVDALAARSTALAAGLLRRVLGDERHAAFDAFG
jgi:hypothetical protein